MSYMGSFYVKHSVPKQLIYPAVLYVHSTVRVKSMTALGDPEAVLTAVHW